MDLLRTERNNRDRASWKHYIRAKVRFDVSKPLRRFKTVNVPGGEVVKILYDYERLQKRCYTCQILTHELSSCHFFQAAKAAAVLNEKGSVCLQKPLMEKIIKEDDPLFGVVLESPVGINPQNGKPKIAEEVLEGMRQYLVDAEGAEKMARKERIKWSLKEVEQDPIAQKTFLRLEPAPVFTSDLIKGKGIVFYFQRQKELPKDVISHGGSTLMASAIRAGNAMSLEPRNMGMMSDTAAFSDSATGSWNPRGPTGYNIGISDVCSSGTKGGKTYQRRRPGSFVRKARGKSFKAEASREGKMKDKAPAVAEKRKSSNDVETSQYSPRSKKPAVVPNEGPPNF
ncbi:PREDICTED: uncharacterized protein LOC106330045 [Brassica oleracea var. oleracea]|uniref:uncharacterized protein LOC106330045 n=1 Tax=Brassica oleracea var. oleracea TaxID=109376 RepID=UPI0006A6FC88|nr:PREDICTED: uncharacterized protein LOC106330045 [Brassica oleracea var. oleracea]